MKDEYSPKRKSKRRNIKKTENKPKQRMGGYPSGSSLSSRRSSSKAPASASKVLVAPSPALSPSPEGGINSTSSGSRPSSSACWRTVTKTLRKYPKRRWCRVANPSSCRHSAAALTPRANASAMSPPPRVGLDKVVGWPLGAHERAADGLKSSPHGLLIGNLFSRTGGVVFSRPPARSSGCRLAGPYFPSLCRGGCHGLVRTVLGSLALTNRYADYGLLPAWRGKQGSRVYLLCLLVHEALSLFLTTALGLSCHLLGIGIPGLKDRQPYARLLCIKQKLGENQTERLTNIGTTNTLRKILKDQKTRRGQEELGEPIQRFPIPRLTPLFLRALHRFYCLGHKFWGRSGLIVLPNVELEIRGYLPLFNCGFPKGISDRLTLVLVRNISPAGIPANEEKVVFLILHL
ncbi:LOW QUALITY PROTEIN: hypothetical protein Cgig2_001792 [Carnegiea gigantea]|uniref:Uncharacterized protein n=1 Tax=Carnegiea gigantea TaxID=171969 RepID=A0A9Q1KFR7_9CARY|nr:LOW QUALITY PROTEIN: hypothetical protein Cgig2_001792 [Carnegiea gigantea]